MESVRENSVLRALDTARTQSYHFQAIVIAGMGFFTDAYDLFVIGTLQKLLGRIYYYDPSATGEKRSPGILPPNVLAAVVSTALCGTLVGQLFFGWAGDKWGRKKVYGITLALMVIASVGQGLSMGNSATSVIATLCFFRFWIGFGIGGDYPLSATIMSEYSNTKTRGAFVAAVFAMQGFGYLAAAAVTIIITAIFKAKYPRGNWDTYQNLTGSNISPPLDGSVPPEADWVWRLVLMFGAVPAALTFYSRSHMPETPRYTALIEKNQKKAALDMGKVLKTQFDSSIQVETAAVKSSEYALFSHEFARRHGKEIIGTCSTWFLLDISYYSQNLFQSKIFQASGWVAPAKYMSALDETFRNASAQAYIAILGTVPGYWFTVALIDRVGRKPIQLMGFLMMSVFMYILAFEFYNLRGIPDASNHKTGYRGGNHVVFIVLYGFTFFFSNFGPNATTFIIPAELFPARLRSTCHGISAAAGKAGSIVGTFGFLYASEDTSHGTSVDPGYKKGIGYEYSFLLLAVCSTLGFFATAFFIPETTGLSLEYLSGEDSASPNEMDGQTDEMIDNNGTLPSLTERFSRLFSNVRTFARP